MAQSQTQLSYTRQTFGLVTSLYTGMQDLDIPTRKGKPSLEVAQTTLAQRTLLYSVRFSSYCWPTVICRACAVENIFPAVNSVCNRQ